MTGRVCAVVAVVLAVVLGTAAPAHADADLPVTIAAVAPNEIRLLAAVPGASATTAPEVTVSRDGQLLPSTVRVDRPQPTPETDLRAVVVVLDTGPVLAGASLRAAQDGLLALAESAPADVAIGLVTVGDRAAVVVRPTRDRAALRTALTSVRAAADSAALRAAGDAAIYDGVRTAADLGAQAADRRVLVVAGGRGGAGTAGRVLNGIDRRVDLIAVGTSADGLGELRRVVTATGGSVRPTAGPGALTEALRSTGATYPPLATITVAVPATMAGSTGTLTVTTGTGTAKASRQLAVRFAPAPEVGGAPDGSESKDLALPTPRASVLAGLVFATLLIAMLLVVSGVDRSTRRRRLRQVDRFRLTGRGPLVSGQTMPDPPAGGFARTATGLPGQPSNVGDRAGAAPAPDRSILVQVASGAAGAIVLGMLGGLVGGLLGALLGWLLARQYPRMRERRRRQAFAEQLPDALQLIVGSLRSGFSLGQAIDAVVQDSTPSPLTEELSRAMGEVRLGSDLDDALERAALRVDNDDLAWAVMAVRIQRDTGGNLAEVLETTVETLRERDRLRRHVRALSAEGRLSGYILIGLPFVMVGWLLMVRREYVSALWTTSLGLMMLVGAAVLMAVGTFWMSRWMKVEV